MRVLWMSVMMIAAASLHAGNALAGPYSDALDRCLVSKATDKDKADLVRWLFASLSRAQDLRDVLSVPSDLREELKRTAAQVFERLFTKDCSSEFLNAGREGDRSPGAGITALSQATIARLLNDPALVNSATELARLIDWSKLETSDGPTKP